MPTIDDLNSAAGADVVRALADDDRDGEADALVVAAVIDAAAREVAAESMRAGVAPEQSPVLGDAVVTLAILRLYERRREPVPPHWVERARRARELARFVGDGAHPLSRAQSSCTHEPHDRTFPPGSLQRL